MKKLLAASVFFFITGTANWCQIQPNGDYSCTYDTFQMCLVYCQANAMCQQCIANPNNQIFK